MLPNRQHIELKSGKISYRQAGTGPDLILLHGLAGNSKSWIHQFEAFTSQFRVTAWDAPGYGQSKLADASVESYSSILNTFTKSIGINNFILHGHSMGGIIAGHYASHYRDRLVALILSCTFLGRNYPRGTVLNANYQKRLKQLNNMLPIEYGRSRVKSMISKRITKTSFDFFSSVTAETKPDGLKAAMHLITEANNTVHFQNLNVPILIIAGELDNVVTKNKTEAMINAIPSHVPFIKTSYLKGVAHAPYIEDPDQYNTTIQSFIESLKS